MAKIKKYISEVSHQLGRSVKTNYGKMSDYARKHKLGEKLQKYGEGYSRGFDANVLGVSQAKKSSGLQRRRGSKRPSRGAGGTTVYVYNYPGGARGSPRGKSHRKKHRSSHGGGEAGFYDPTAIF